MSKKTSYEITRAEEMRHFEREQVSVKWYQTTRKFITGYVSMDTLTFQNHLTDVQLQQHIYSISIIQSHIQP